MELQINHLIKQYECSPHNQKKGREQTFVLKNVNFAVQSGELIGITGISGSGKSTLLGIIGGFLKPSGGLIQLDGDDIGGFSETKLAIFHRNRIGYIPQGIEVLANLTVIENTAISDSFVQHNDRKNTGENRAREVLEMVGIAKLAGEYPDVLSGGEKRRVAIARALYRDPDIILADEPTNDLDRENSVLLINLFRKLVKDGKIIILATHDNENLDSCDAVYRLDDGKIFRMKPFESMVLDETSNPIESR